MKRPPHPSNSVAPAFTLVELLVSMAIIMLLLLVLVQMTDAVRRTWSQTSSRIEQFREARDAFESMTRRVSQASLNTFWDYDSLIQPKAYIRQSELRFICGYSTSDLAPTGELNLGIPSNPPRPTEGIFFQAPFGFAEDPNYAHKENLVNTWGFYLEWGTDKEFRPPFLDSVPSIKERWRVRLMELMEPSESLTIYKHTSGATNGTPNNLTYQGKQWFLTPLAATAPKRVRPIAENIIWLQFTASDPSGNGLGGGKDYYSTTGDTNATGYGGGQKNQLPPVIRLTMVAVDEPSFSRYIARTGEQLPDWYGSASVGDLTNRLNTDGITYRQFTTNVALRSAKWSK